LTRTGLDFVLNDSVHEEALLWEVLTVDHSTGEDDGDGATAKADCLDFWIYLDTPGAMRLDWVTPEGHQALIPMVGDPDVDAEALIEEFRRVIDEL
jgi:hypothetical protein